MDIAALGRMIAENAALRRRQVLQPAGGKGDKIFPPTYPGEGRNALPRHVVALDRHFRERDDAQHEIADPSTSTGAAVPKFFLRSVFLPRKDRRKTPSVS